MNTEPEINLNIKVSYSNLCQIFDNLSKSDELSVYEKSYLITKLLFSSDILTARVCQQMSQMLKQYATDIRIHIDNVNNVHNDDNIDLKYKDIDNNILLNTLNTQEYRAVIWDSLYQLYKKELPSC